MRLMIRMPLSLILIAALLLTGCRARSGPRSGPLLASGTIEAEELRVAPEMGGRVAELAADKGDVVLSGAVLARLDTALLEAQRDHARSVVEQAQGALQAAHAQLAKARAGARPEEVASARSALAAAEAGLKLARSQRDAAAAQQRTAEANLAATKGQAKASQAMQAGAQAGIQVSQAGLTRAQTGATAEELGIATRALEDAKSALWGAQAQRDSVCAQVGRGARQSDCDAAKAAVQRAEEGVGIAELRLEQVRKGVRTEDLAALQAGVSQAQAGLSAAQADADSAQARVQAAEASLAGVTANLAGAEAGLDAASAQRDQAQAALDLILAGARAEDLALLEAQVRQCNAVLAGAEASLRGIETQIARMTLTSPAQGVVLVRAVHVGELIAAGTPLFTLADLARLTLTVYIPEADLGQVALGQEVRVSVDAHPGETYAGHVTYIASRAEFTPKNVETREERVNMVFAVEIKLDSTDGRLLPGMPADAVFTSR